MKQNAVDRKIEEARLLKLIKEEFPDLDLHMGSGYLFSKLVNNKVEFIELHYSHGYSEVGQLFVRFYVKRHGLIVCGNPVELLVGQENGKTVLLDDHEEKVQEYFGQKGLDLYLPVIEWEMS